MGRLTNRQMQVLQGVGIMPRDASNIAQHLNEETHWIASPLKALEHKGLIFCTRRGGKGLPSWWQITDAGRAALAQEKGQ